MKVVTTVRADGSKHIPRDYGTALLKNKWAQKLRVEEDERLRWQYIELTKAGAKALGLGNKPGDVFRYCASVITPTVFDQKWVSKPKAAKHDEPDAYAAGAERLKADGISAATDKAQIAEFVCAVARDALIRCEQKRGLKLDVLVPDVEKVLTCLSWLDDSSADREIVSLVAAAQLFEYTLSKYLKPKEEECENPWL